MVKAARGMFHFYAPLASSIGEEPCRELCPPTAPQPVAGALRFCSLAGDLAKQCSARAKGEMAKGERVRCSLQQAGDGGPCSKALQERGHPESGGRVLLCSAGCATLRSVPYRLESAMLGDRSSSARVLLWFLGTQPSPGDVHARSWGGRTEDGSVWEVRWHRPWRMSR